MYRHTTEKERIIAVTQNTHVVPDNGTYKGDLMSSFVVKDATIQKASSNALYNA